MFIKALKLKNVTIKSFLHGAGAIALFCVFSCTHATIKESNVAQPKSEQNKECDKSEKTSAADQLIDNVIKPQVFFREGNAVKVNSVAPTFVASNIRGEKVDTSDNDDKIILLNFWSIRCGPCIKEMPYLEELYKEYKEKGIVIISINTDQAPKEEVSAFMAGRDFTVSYNVLVDPDLILSSVFTKWFVPVTILIDSKGIIRYNNTGFTKRDYEKYRKIIEGLLKE